MKNLLNSIRKQREKPIIYLQGVKNLQNLARKMGKKTRCWLIEDRDKRLDQRLEHNIHIWGHKGHCYMSGTTKTTAAFKSFSATPYFLPLLLANLFRQLRFRFGSFGTKSLAIDGVKSKGGEVAIGFSGCSL